ncbi:RagB/SusD family nutrient uptake outer membrane protein [Dysgonomonas termitidis]|uniref:RagB/SusD family nutrient uptake outer membrane protein n=1 Tax=Dysgonomonas termitidis TaxID=1516126 RepID=A0ABV9L3F9_9BACT
MKLKSIISILGGVMLLSACTDLSEDLYDKVGSGDYGKTPAEVETIVGRAYSSLRGGASDGVNFYPTSEFVFFVPSVASDECVIPTRTPNDDWYDGGMYLDIQRHQWKPDNPKLWALWKYAYNGIAATNAIIYQVEQSGLDEEASKPLFAELKCLRAYYYYKLLDWYGNVPIEISYIVENIPETSSRADVYKFIEEELTGNINYLPTEGYGRFTQNAANLLLARLYLNSEVYIGQARWNDCLTVCSKISGQLEPDYFTSFKTENQTSKEIIFSIPYDNKMGTLGNFLHSMTFHYEQKWAISATGNYQWCGNGISAQPGLYSAFEETDIRRKSILMGPQIDLRTGSTIIMPASGNPLVYTEEITDITKSPQNEGGRLNKYEVKEGVAWERDHDLVLMRYAEVLMMQAESNIRLGNAGAARPFIEQIRSRAGLTTPETIDLNFIDQELRREFVFEDHRRTDNIRFGTYYGAWWEKPADSADKHTGLFPIPAQEIAKNNKLKQNPGYN